MSPPPQCTFCVPMSVLFSELLLSCGASSTIVTQLGCRFSSTLHFPGLCSGWAPMGGGVHTHWGEVCFALRPF